MSAILRCPEDDPEQQKKKKNTKISKHVHGVDSHIFCSLNVFDLADNRTSSLNVNSRSCNRFAIILSILT